MLHFLSSESIDPAIDNGRRFRRRNRRGSTWRRDRHPHPECLETRITPSTWIGGGTDSNWTTPASWAGGIVPNAGAALVFPVGATHLVAVNDFSAGAIFNSIEVGGAGYVLSGNAINLVQGITTTYSSGMSSDAIDTQLGGTISVGAGGELDLNGVLTGSDGLTVAGGGKLVLGGAASNTYAGPAVDNGSTLVLSKSGGADAIPGNLVIGDGTSPALVQATAANQIATGSSVTVNNGGTLDLNGNSNTIGGLTLSGGTVTTGAGILTVGGNITVNDPGNSSSSISGNLDLGGAARTFSVANGRAATELSISAVISDSAAGIIVAGGGTVNLSGLNTYSGPTTINGSGTQVLVDGAIGAVQVNAGATLGGGGTVGNVTSTGGTINPGDSHGSLNAGTLRLNATSTFDVQLDGPATVGPGQLVASGAVNLGSATLDAALGGSYTPKVGDLLTIIRNTSGSGVTGTFTGLPEGSTLMLSGYRFGITYEGGSGGDVVLTALPFPTTTAISPSTQTSTYGHSVSFTAVVTGGQGNPSGAVAFFDGSPAAGGKTLGSAATTTLGVATFATTALSVTGSPHQIYAVYLPSLSSNNAGSTTVLPSSVTITPATITASLAGTVTKTYDGTAAATLSTGNYLLSGRIGGDDVSLNDPSSGTYDTKGVGSAKTVSVLDLSLLGQDAGNYVLASSSASGPVGVINAKLVTVAGVTAQGKVYDSTPNARIDTSSATLSSGVIAGDDVSLVTARAVGSFVDKNVGTFKTVIVSGLSLSGTDKGNYTVFPPTGVNASITPAPLTVTANPASMTHGGPVPTLTDTISGLVGAETAATALSGTLATTATSSSHAGSYPITQGTLTAVNGNYTISFIGANLSVAPAPLLISANNLSKVYGAPVPPLTASYSGFVNGDTAARLSAPPTLTDSATATSPPGAYGINAAGASSGDYTISYVPGTLTVTKAVTSAGLISPISTAVAGRIATFTVQVAAVRPGAGNPAGMVALVVDGTRISTIAVDPTTGKASLSTPLIGLGAHSVTALYLGDSNFEASQSNSNRVVVSAADTQSILMSQAVRNKRGKIVSVNLLSQVLVVSPGDGMPTGVITYFRRGHQIRTVALSDGKAVLKLKRNHALEKSFTVRYGGDLNFNASASSLVVVTKRSLKMR
jgi:autotransporter-associated beta strand protein